MVIFGYSGELLFIYIYKIIKYDLLRMYLV